MYVEPFRAEKLNLIFCRMKFLHVSIRHITVFQRIQHPLFLSLGGQPHLVGGDVANLIRFNHFLITIIGLVVRI